MRGKSYPVAVFLFETIITHLVQKSKREVIFCIDFILLIWYNNLYR